ncbi:MAG: ATP-dependent DNA ligase, partial [Casimicrobiaceae bacterium]
MKRFAQLFAALDATTATRAKVEALKRYFAEAPPRDAAWAAYFLAGGKPRQVVPTRVLRELACQRAGIEDWLFDAAYQAAGDLAETIAYILPSPSFGSDVGFADWIENRLQPLRGMAREQQTALIAEWWDTLESPSRFLLTKLIGGGFRVGVSKLLVQRALAEAAGVDAKLVAQRMMGYTDAHTAPTAERYAFLTAAPAIAGGDRGAPYPFFLAHPLAANVTDLEAALGPPADWIVEWKYDGIRAQVVRRDHHTWIWSRGEELVSEPFPELVEATAAWPTGTGLDGEIVVWIDQAVAPFALLQRRLGRKTLTPRILAEAPVALIAYDILEHDGIDVREAPQAQRRAMLEALAARTPGVLISPVVTAPDWDGLALLRRESRARGVEGFMLKHREARYGIGRRKPDGTGAATWWKWKVEPFTVDAVLIYAQAGHGRRAGLYTDYTFAVWNRAPIDGAEAQGVVDAIAKRQPAAPTGLQLVPFAKAYGGLTDDEFKAVDRVIRRSTLEKFGPVRSVVPSMVFELGFEGINRSSRHKSGLAVR